MKVAPLSKYRKGSSRSVGGKAANLGELISMGVNVPQGFVVTANSFQEFINETDLQTRIRKFTNELDFDDHRRFQYVANRIQQIVQVADMPEALYSSIAEQYSELCNKGFSLVAVRSSAIGEDGKGASFAGQHDTFLGISGIQEVINAIKACFASLFTPRAITYRIKQGMPLLEGSMAVVVQTFIDSKYSGVMFTRDPNTGSTHTIIECVRGLGEALVSGQVNPVHYKLIKEDESWKLIDYRSSNQTRELSISKWSDKSKSTVWSKCQPPMIPHEALAIIANDGRIIEETYGKAQDVEWAIDRNTILYILQTRPITTLKAKTKQELSSSETPIVEGFAASFGVANGKVRIIQSANELYKVEKGDILVTSMTTPDFVPVFDKIAGLVTDFGGSTCHAAIVSREYNIPCVVGTNHATNKLTNGMTVTVDGGNGVVYETKD